MEKTEKTYTDIITPTNFKEIEEQAINSITGESQNPITLNGRTLKMPNGYYMENNSIYKLNLNNNKSDLLVCSHPVGITNIFQNVETGIEKAEITFTRRGTIKSIVKDKSLISKTSKMSDLSDNGIGVTDSNSRLMVDYFQRFEIENENSIPVEKSISHLGWINGYKEFLPFTESVLNLDNKDEYKEKYESVTESQGDLSQYVHELEQLYKLNPVTKILICSCVGSVLLEPLNVQNYSIHLWGGSGSGKSLIYKVISSIWGEPKKYIEEITSTDNAIKLISGFFKNMPLILDESQTDKDRDFGKLVYLLCQGKDKRRATTTGHLNTNIMQWANVSFTNGENPILNETTGTGANIRTIEINVNDKLFGDLNPRKIMKFFSSNYGLLGKDFIKKIITGYKGITFDVINTLFDKTYEEVDKRYKELIPNRALNNITLILLSDYLLHQFYFKNSDNLDVKDIVKFIKTKEEVSTEKKGYEYLIEVVASNPTRFDNFTSIEKWGIYDEDNEQIYIIRSKFNSILDDGGYHYKTILNYMKSKNKVFYDNKKKVFNKAKRINSVVVNTILINLDTNPFIN